MEEKIKTEIAVYSLKNVSEEVQKLQNYQNERWDKIILLYFDCTIISGKFSQCFSVKKEVQVEKC